MRITRYVSGVKSSGLDDDPPLADVGCSRATSHRFDDVDALVAFINARLLAMIGDTDNGQATEIHVPPRT